MLKRRTDLPLDADLLTRFLPWLIAFMVYLAALAQAGIFGFDSMAQRWDRGLTTAMTVQVPTDPSLNADGNGRRVQTVLNVLARTPGVLRADMIDEAKVLELLKPWLGDVSSGDIPLPVLIDVETDPAAVLDARVLSQKLSTSVPGTRIDDHGVWLDRLVQLVRAMEGLAAIVLAFILLAAAGTVVFTTKTGLAVHHATIEVLHLTGAHDRYIAAQFAWRAMTLGLKGGLIGLALALPTLFALGFFAGRLEQGLVPNMELGLQGWVSLALLPLAAAVVAWATARITVMRNLKRMI